ncbi:hypothetical protein BS78_01G179600 [Paspalum vaginatum]|nr:hypothetical protein BS78_01G179600 [Paspalum vaginatum]
MRRFAAGGKPTAMPPHRPALPAAAVLLLLALLAAVGGAGGVEILAKSRVESCAVDSGNAGRLSCAMKLVVNMAVPSGSSGGEASMVVKLEEVVDNDTQSTGATRNPPVVTVSKSDEFALYDLTYLTDVAYRPEEQFVETRKCEPDAGADIVRSCERLWYENGSIIPHTEPVCCPCGPHRRLASSCGNFFDKMVKGKANTAHCLRFPGDWFHVWEIGTRSLGFSIRVKVRKGSSELDAGSGQPQDLGAEYSKWMLLERVRFTLDHLECDKIGVGYEAFQNQPNFCTVTFGSCLFDQLWNYWEFDQTRISKNQQPQYVVQGRFPRVNQHPNAGGHTFSIGVTEVINTNLLVELSADDIEYVYQRSPGEIVEINVAPFEALSQVGTAKVTTKNIGKLEASYSLTFHCSNGTSPMGEQSYIMKPDEVTNRSFSFRAPTDKAATYQCEATLKASDYSILDSAQCHFSTTATVFDNGTQIGSPNPKKGGFWGFIDAIRDFCLNFWDFLIDFFNGKSCSTKCSSWTDFSCHTQYVCISWVATLLLLLVTLPIAAVVLWLLHQKGFFDPVYDWWEDLWGLETHDRGHPRHKKGRRHHHHHHWHSHRHGDHPHRHHHAHAHQRHKSEPSHHHAPHRRREHGAQQQREAAAEDHRHRHDQALGVQHREAGKRHGRHDKAVPVAPRLDGPSRPRETQEDAPEFRERTRYNYKGSHAGHELHDRDRHRHRHHSWEV